MPENLKPFNDMVDRVFLELWERKTGGHALESENFENFPIRRFDIERIHSEIQKRHDLSNQSDSRVAAILADLKLLFYFLGNTTDYFHVGTAMIVGNSDYHDVNLNTLSILQGNHYKVYLASSTYERILDLLDLIHSDRINDPKKNKWGKKFETLNQSNAFLPISPTEHEMMIEFRDRVRRAEVHGFSSVFRQLKAEKWDHLQDECDFLGDLLVRIADEYK